MITRQRLGICHVQGCPGDLLLLDSARFRSSGGCQRFFKSGIGFFKFGVGLFQFERSLIRAVRFRLGLRLRLLRFLRIANRGDCQTVRSGKDLVDHENLRKKLPAELDALPTVLRDSHALHIRFRVDQVAEVLANRRVVLGDEHSDLCHAEHSRSGQALGKVPFGHM